MLYQSFEILSQKVDCLVVLMSNNLLENTTGLSAELSADLQTNFNNAALYDDKWSDLLLHNIQADYFSSVLFINQKDKKTTGFGDTLYKALKNTSIQSISIANAVVAEVFIKEIEYAGYQYDQTLSKKSTAIKLKTVAFFGDTAVLNATIKTATATANGVNFARKSANLPANFCTPSDLAETAASLASDTIKVSAMGEAEMTKLGMGSLLSVSRGSDQEAKLITLEYAGAKDVKPFVLVGKGVTFDSGGISLKPGASMDEMKFDMCGAASVLGVFKALSGLDLPINVVGIIPATENMPNGKATKPGDVVTSMSGQTIEVLNTDAEGRLILCDALTYADKFNPQQVIDIATLTGAVIIALGNNISGLMSNNEALADELLTASQESNDKIWRLPLADVDEGYDELLKSNFADIANIGGRPAGTITAGCFLAKFTKDYQWAHIDIAGTAWKQGKEKGATGRPVNLLMRYLLNKIG